MKKFHPAILFLFGRIIHKRVSVRGLYLVGPAHLLARTHRLYEQRGDKQRLWEYVTRWHRWLHGGLRGLVSRKGGVKRYYIYILHRLE